ncbi:hypothetical protein ACEQ8H_007441 [Pleosporales sp. CAS-2024a]
MSASPHVACSSVRPVASEVPTLAQRLMPGPAVPASRSRKRQRFEAAQLEETSQRAAKRQRFDRQSQPPAPHAPHILDRPFIFTFWDTLSKVWLTRNALKELDKRTRGACPTPRPASSAITAHSKQSTVQYTKRASPCVRTMSSRRSNHRSRGLASAATQSTLPTMDTQMTTSTGPYCQNFEQILVDNGIYPDGYEYPNGGLPPLPDRRCRSGAVPFGNLKNLTDPPPTQGKPDVYYRARPKQLERGVRDALDHHITPSTQGDLPVAPNFFTKVKGPDGSLAVADRQACYSGALGARAMHSLQMYERTEGRFDSNAYTITNTYHGGTLTMYTSHIGPAQAMGERHETFMHELIGCRLTSSSDAFRAGATAYRNARDWAQEQRDTAIAQANHRFRAQTEASNGNANKPNNRKRKNIDVSTDEAAPDKTAKKRRTVGHSMNMTELMIA